MSLVIEKSYDKEKDIWMVTPKGELDISTVASFKAVLEEIFKEKETDISLIADGLEYVDSTGLGAIIGAYGRMKEKGKTIFIVSPGPTMKKLLAITSLDQVFTIL